MENKVDVNKLLEKHIEEGIFERFEDKFKFTAKGAKLYQEYLGELSKAMVNIPDFKEKGFQNLEENELKTIIHESLMRIYKDNMPAIFIHVLQKAKELGFETYAKFEFVEPSPKDTFH